MGDSAVPDDILSKASTIDQDLYSYLMAHTRDERSLIEEYEQATHEASSPAFTYLVDLIIEEERTHHRRFEDLAASLRAEVELRRDAPVIPRIASWGGLPGHLTELTERFLAAERADAKELKRLAKALADRKDTTLWHLLVRLMQADTAKHIEILEFIREHAQP